MVRKKYTVQEMIGEGISVDIGHNVIIPKYMLKSIPKGKIKAGYFEYKYNGQHKQEVYYLRTK